VDGQRTWDASRKPLEIRRSIRQKSNSLSPQEAALLQRTVGNYAVARHVQARFGPPASIMRFSQGIPDVANAMEDAGALGAGIVKQGASAAQSRPGWGSTE